MIAFLEKYKSLKLIEDNGSKLIYSGINSETNQNVIIKIYSESDYNGSDFERLRNNIKSRKLIKNDNIVKIYNIERKIYSGTNYYILELEYVDGETLESLIEFSTFSEVQALQIISQVIYGLKSLKKAKLKLENISPSDILLDINGTIKIDLSADMLSKDERECLDNNQSEIYSLGVILYKLITKEDYNITKKINKSMVSNILSEILDRCLNKSSVIRYYDLDEMLSNINEYVYYGLEDNDEEVEISESKGGKRKLVKVACVCTISGLILASTSFAITQIANLKDDTNDITEAITATNIVDSNSTVNKNDDKKSKNIDVDNEELKNIESDSENNKEESKYLISSSDKSNSDKGNSNSSSNKNSSSSNKNNSSSSGSTTTSKPGNNSTNKKPVTKPTTKPVTKPESKPEQDTATKPESKPEEDTTTKPESKPEEDTTTKPESKPEEDTTTKPESKPEEDTTTNPESKPEEDTTTKPESKPE